MRTAFLRSFVVVLSITTIAAAAEPDAIRQEMKDREARGGQRSATQYTPKVITEARADYWLLIPAAGSLAGSQGTFFKSDLMISNHRSTAQLVDFSWCQQGITCAGNGFQLKRVSIPGNSAVFFDDVIGKTLGKSGLGTLDLRARLADGSLDTDAKIDAFSRIWTPMANAGGTIFAGGTTSQSFPSVRIDSLVGTARAFILGLQQDSRFRTNIGIYNDDIFTAHTFTIQIIGTNGQTTYTMTVQPWTMAQGGIPAGNWGNIIAIITPESSFGFENWAAYGSSTDATTGDGWVSVGSQND